MSPYLFSLSNELLIEIISNLRPPDIHACQCACRRLNNVIVNSKLIQYVLRTALSGIFDTLESGISLPDRLDALERWETAWREMDLSKPVASIDVLQVVHSVSLSENQQVVDLFGEQHVITSRLESLDVPAGYSFVDLHSWSSSPNVTCWTTIDIQGHDVLLFAFAPELNLSVVFSKPEPSDHRNISAVISPMWFSTGEPHPLASRSKLDVTLSCVYPHNLLEAHQATIIGDYILYWIGSTTLCNICLVAWKEGWVSELRALPPYEYGLELSVLSQDIILLIRSEEPALELCRLTNIGDSVKASLDTICILSLPELTFGASLQWVGIAEEQPDHAIFSKNPEQYLSPHPESYTQPTTSSGTSSSIWQPECRFGSHFRFVPSDGIVRIAMQVNTSQGRYRMVNLVVRSRTLLDFANPQAQVDATGVMGMGVRTVLMVPWETWGPTNSRILDGDSETWDGLSGERCATVVRSRITMRDYNPYRVRRALALLGVAGKEVTRACGSVVKVINEASVYPGGECFCDDIETSLPYIETVTLYKGCLDIFLDVNYLVAEVLTTAGERKMYLHSMCQ